MLRKLLPLLIALAGIASAQTPSLFVVGEKQQNLRHGRTSGRGGGRDLSGVGWRKATTSRLSEGVECEAYGKQHQPTRVAFKDGVTRKQGEAF